MIRIAFVAVAQVHQHLHFLPAALRLAAMPDVEVHVLSGSRASLNFIRSYDPHGLLKLRHLWTPSVRPHGPFSPPPRRLTLALWHRLIGSFDAVVSTEATVRVLKRFGSFRSPLILIPHGMGDRAVTYKPALRTFDYILAVGEKSRERYVERGLIAPERCAVTGYGKFELIRQHQPIFTNDRPIALYNPHFDPRVSSLWLAGEAIVRAMSDIKDWNFIVAPHVKFRKRRSPPNIAPRSQSILFDPGSVSSVDMTYTQSAAVYIGDASSQVYEFIRTPRPCIFINAHRVAWQNDPYYTHWSFGQVIESAEELAPALARAVALQPQYEEAQRRAFEWSNAPAQLPASERQARAILEFIRGTGG